MLVRVGHRFGRVDLRRQMRAYVNGLLGPVGRKNSWQLAEYVGHRTPAGLQNLLNRARWSPDEVRDDLQKYIAEKLGEPGGVLIIDDIPEEGHGLGRRPTAVLGDRRPHGELPDRGLRRLHFLARTGTGGPGVVSAEVLYGGRDHCETAKIPDDRDFATKGDLAKAMIQRAMASPLPIAWVTADSGSSGRCRTTRAATRDHLRGRGEQPVVDMSENSAAPTPSDGSPRASPPVPNAHSTRTSGTWTTSPAYPHKED